jgi:hypothetical protein
MLDCRRCGLACSALRLRKRLKGSNGEKRQGRLFDRFDESKNRVATSRIGSGLFAEKGSKDSIVDRSKKKGSARCVGARLNRGQTQSSSLCFEKKGRLDKKFRNLGTLRWQVRRWPA